MISLFFGLPRCGKTTVACKMAKKYVKQGRPVYVNFPCKVDGVTHIQNEWIGKYDMSDGVIIIDEASIYADSRSYKKFSTQLVEFFCLHGHWGCDILLFTQIYNRVDSTIRMMAEQVYMVRKNPILRFITTVYRVPYGIAFSNTEGDKQERKQYGEINEGYKAPSFMQKITAMRVYRPRYYKYFDTHWKPYTLPPIPADFKV